MTPDPVIASGRSVGRTPSTAAGRGAGDVAGDLAVGLELRLAVVGPAAREVATPDRCDGRHSCAPTMSRSNVVQADVIPILIGTGGF